MDCPDPDTQDPDDGAGGQRHLDILRTVLPHCDVMVHTVTSQKYKSHVVGQELLKNAPGRQILYVQTHAAHDPDNRADLRKYLDALGLRVPEVFRFDAVEALAHQEHGEPVDGEFSRFRDLLEHELASRARHRIRRANLLGLYEWLLATIKAPITTGLEAVSAPGADDGPGPLDAPGQDPLAHDRAHRHQPATLAIADPPSVNPVLGCGTACRTSGSLVGRGKPDPVVDLAASQNAHTGPPGRRSCPQPARQREVARASGNNGLGCRGRPGVDRGRPGPCPHAFFGATWPTPRLSFRPRQSRVLRAATFPANNWRLWRWRPTSRLSLTLARRSRTAWPVEPGAWSTSSSRSHSASLPAYLVFHMGRNFFYEHLWLERPLLGLDFFFQAAFWCLVWGVLIGGLLLAWLNRGLDRELKDVVVRLSPEHLFDALYADSTASCQAIRRHVSVLDTLQRDLKQLENQVGGVLDLGLGALRASNLSMLPPPSLSPMLPVDRVTLRSETTT